MSETAMTGEIEALCETLRDDLPLRIEYRMQAADALARLTAELAEYRDHAAPYWEARALTAEAALAKAQDGATLAGLLDQADDVWTDYGSGFRIHFSFPPSHQSDVILRINRRRCRARATGESP